VTALEALTERDNFPATRAELDHADEQLARDEFTEYDERAIRGLPGSAATEQRGARTFACRVETLLDALFRTSNFDNGARDPKRVCKR
jgi:hypothetical protein